MMVDRKVSVNRGCARLKSACDFVMLCKVREPAITGEFTPLFIQTNIVEVTYESSGFCHQVFLLMPEGHPLFLFSVDGRNGCCAVRQFPWGLLSLKLTEVHQTWLRWSWALCSQTVYRILLSATRGPSLFSDRNEKMGLDGAMVQLDGWNLRI